VTALDAEAPGAHILVVDDDKRLRVLLSKFLMAEGYSVSSAANADEAMARLRDLVFDLIVLDRMMPGESGEDLARRLRRREEPLRSAPILMLTALTEAHDRVIGLEAGVDDYLAKPFEPRELALRIASILRRTRKASAAPHPRVARFGEFAYDLERGELLRGAIPVRLTSREREILRLLVLNHGAVAPRQALARRETGQDIASERSVDVDIARLRRKIEEDAGAPRHLLTVRGQGYRLLAQVVDAIDARNR
jgi:two-component system, OmpR family, phosphate regulon response regulator OmpR